MRKRNDACIMIYMYTARHSKLYLDDFGGTMQTVQTWVCVIGCEDLSMVVLVRVSSFGFEDGLLGDEVCAESYDSDAKAGEEISHLRSCREDW